MILIARGVEPERTIVVFHDCEKKKKPAGASSKAIVRGLKPSQASLIEMKKIYH